jgi:hypothetical protein
MRKIFDLEKTLQSEGYTNLGILNSGRVVIPEGCTFEELEHENSITLFVCYEHKLYYTQDSSD